MSFFHRVKKAVVGVSETPGQSLCPDYDFIKVEFDGLYDSMLRLRQQLLAWREANSRLWMTAATLSNDFAGVLDVGDHHPYTSMASTLKSSHNQLPSERDRVTTMLNACLDPMTDLTQRYDALRERMVTHDKLKAEVIYYRGKVDGLKKTRNAAKESEKDKEKYERNIKKLQDEEAAFQEMDLHLVQDLRTAYAQRVMVFGPIMLAFVLTEKTMVKAYDKAITDVQLVNYDEEKAWLATQPNTLLSPRSPTSPPSSTASTATTATVSSVTSSSTQPAVVTVASSTTEPAVDLVSHYASHSSSSDSVASHPVTSTPLTTTAPLTSTTLTPLTTSGVVISDPLTVHPPVTPNSRFSDFVPDFGSPTGTGQVMAGDPFGAAPDWPSTPSGGAWEAQVPPYTMGSAATQTAAASTSSTAPAHANGTASHFPVTSGVAEAEVGALSGVAGAGAVGGVVKGLEVPVADDLALDSAKAQHDGVGVVGGKGSAESGVSATEFDKVDLSSPIGSHDL